MKFSAAGGWFGGDWYENVRLGAKYGFSAVEQLGWNHLDLDRARATLDDNGITSTCIVIQSKEHPEYGAVEMEIIDETRNPEIAEKWDYYYVPTYFLGEEKLHEGAATKQKVQRVYEKALNS